ncbi:G-protein coupled receptor 4-like [Amia ocellicauda]|uniref:G-protein coupled receptor 4-like n=1 Tax=Amia ocellicauda TaxID=2972642 RepID=UPI0034648D26
MDNQTQSNGSTCYIVHNLDKYLYPPAYSIFFIIGLPANCMSLYVAWILARNGNNMAVYLVNLSISDLLYIISLPVWIEHSLQHSVDRTLCSFIDLIMNNSFYVGASFLCCISVDRYLAVVYPLHFRTVRSIRFALFMSIAVWCAELSLQLGFLYYTESLLHFSEKNMCEKKDPMDSKQAHVALVRVVYGFLLPLLLMSLCFVRIMRALNQSVATLGSERRKIKMLLLLLLLTYIVSFAPYQTVMFIESIWEPGNCAFAQRMVNPYLIVVALTTINSVVDPILYCLLSESAKTEMKKLLQCIKVTFEKIIDRHTAPHTSAS